MSNTTRFSVASLIAFGIVVRASAQAPQQPAGQLPQRGQPGVVAPPQQPPVQQAAPQPPQVPPGFQLNPLEEAYLNTVLTTWEMESGKINSFKCSFERWEYNPTFGPAPEIPLNKDKGELSFLKPDKGSFQITEIKRWQAAPLPPGQPPPQPAQGDWMVQKDAIGEHWVCDGKSVFEYRQQDTTLVERPIPPDLRGKSIMDGPLPFLFGAEARKLRDRYFLRVDRHPDPNQIWLSAKPKWQADAANYVGVQVILDRQRMLPTAMSIHLPDNSRHDYMFDVANATVNSPFAKLQSLFERPPLWSGWKRVVEQAPMEQAAQPVQPPR